jgi:hypothetical protein
MGKYGDEDGCDETENAFPDVFSGSPDVACEGVPDCDEGGTEGQTDSETEE